MAALTHLRHGSLPHPRLLAFLSLWVPPQPNPHRCWLPPLASTQAGMFPDVAERLVQAHLGKGDTMSALITGGWGSGVH